MKRIKELVEQIDEELEGAMCYAEKYIESRADGSNRAEVYRGMAADELGHAGHLHTYAVEEIEKLKKVYEAPTDMKVRWDESHRGYVEREARIRSMIDK